MLGKSVLARSSNLHVLSGRLGKITIEVDLSLLGHDLALRVSLPLGLRGYAGGVHTAFTHDVATGQVVLVQRVDSVATRTTPALEHLPVTLIEGTTGLHRGNTHQKVSVGLFLCVLLLSREQELFFLRLIWVLRITSFPSRGSVDKARACTQLTAWGPLKVRALEAKVLVIEA